MLGTEEALPFEEEMDEWVNERIQTVKGKRKKRCCLSGPGDLTRWTNLDSRREQDNSPAQGCTERSISALSFAFLLCACPVS